MGALDRQGIHRGDNRGGKVVAGCPFDKLAFTIAGIIECQRSALFPEVGELRRPHALVRSDSMQEDDRDIATADLVDADPASAGCDARHGDACHIPIDALQERFPIVASRP